MATESGYYNNIKKLHVKGDLAIREDWQVRHSSLSPSYIMPGSKEAVSIE